MADLSSRPIPLHVAVIMDGNGRWAAARGLPRVAGHREGAKAVRRTIEAAISQGVRYLTLFAFSSENWRRPAGEVADLTFLMKHYLRSELAELHEQGVRLVIIGERERFAAGVVERGGAAGAVEQREAEFLFKPLHLRAHGGLRQTDARARAGKCAVLAHGDKSLEFAQHVD